jgi:putative molybdopterin biosynthesis protein
MLLDSLLRKNNILPDKVKGFKREENTHVAVATAIERGEADTGLGAQSAAGAAGLDFIPLVKERYDLVALREKATTVPLNLVSEVVRSAVFRTMLGSIPGYDTSATGRTLTVRP